MPNRKAASEPEPDGAKALAGFGRYAGHAVRLGGPAAGPDLVSPDLVSLDLVSPEAAARLLRWYPKGWRSRYGEEFTELLISDISERPGSWARTADVARGGIVARLAGLTGGLA
jgi:hypothetical protein